MRLSYLALLTVIYAWAGSGLPVATNDNAYDGIDPEFSAVIETVLE